MTTQQSTSVYPKTDKRQLPPHVVANAFAMWIDSTRFTHVSINDAIRELVEELDLVLPEGHSPVTLAQQIMQRVRDDSVYDAEHQMARRASVTVLTELFGDAVEVRGWVNGATPSSTVSHTPSQALRAKSVR